MQRQPMVAARVTAHGDNSGPLAHCAVNSAWPFLRAKSGEKRQAETGLDLGANLA